MNLPNKITIFRICLIPVVMILAAITSLQEIYIFKEIEFLTLGNLIMLIIFLIGAFSDFLDGYIARKRHIVTDFGKFADPLADKILVLAMLIILVEQDTLLDGWVVTIILAREFIVTGFRVIAASKNKVIAAGWLGKIKTNLQFGIIIVLLIVGEYALGTIWEIIIITLVYLTALITIVSGAEYIYKNRNVIL